VPEPAENRQSKATVQNAAEQRCCGCTLVSQTMQVQFAVQYGKLKTTIKVPTELVVFVILMLAR
jgi:hypothetical protein